MDHSIKRVTVVGTGVIGNGWIGRFLAQGYDVIATDPAEHAEERVSLRPSIKLGQPLKNMGVVPGASKDRSDL